VNITVLVGGVGGARFLVGVRAAYPDAEITAVVNVGDDIWLHGLRICPDLDTCMYTLGGAVDPDRGWGHAGETWSVRDELAAYGADPDWFGLGDKDTATHLVRSRMLRAGYPLSDVTAALCHRWQPGVTLLPVTDDRVETHVVVDDAASMVGPASDPPVTGPKVSQKAIHFQEWWIRHKGELPAHRFASIGAAEATVLPAARDAITGADVVLIAPSNPVVSIGSLLDVPGARDALRATAAPVVGVSPIIGGRPLRGMADRCLTAIGVGTTAAAVGVHYGSRARGGILDGWLIAPGDSADVPGVSVRSVPLLMTDVAATAQMARDAVELGAP
jgi:LPPG:FO 2-phospho-L-lactate transferase